MTLQPILIKILCLLLSLPMVASTQHFRVPPKNCTEAFLARHFDQVLPCYVASPDQEYQWEIISEQSTRIDDLSVLNNVNIINVQMHSLRWPPAKLAQVDYPVWRHRLTLYQPEKIHSKSALLYINGGTIHSDGSKTEISQKQYPNDDIYFARIAARTGSVIVDLKDIPNQFLTFDQQKPLKEDALIAYTWQQFLENPDKSMHWPLRLPMVKASVRAMDTVQKILSDREINISDFVLAGGSKRGWTVWLTAAMDKRVSAIIPMVIDILNLQVNMNHHKQVYGTWAPAVRDYLELMKYLNSEPMARLMEIIDPYSYRKLITIPKYIISATGDDFFLPDASRFYFDDLTGPKWLRVLPNLRHYIVKMDRMLVNDTIESFFSAVINDKELPEIKTEYNNGFIKLSSSIKPEKVLLWTAQNAKARDFRIASPTPPDKDFSATSVPFTCSAKCSLEIPIKLPEQGWKASYVELIYANPPYRDLSFTSRIFITPDTYPVFDNKNQ